MGILDKSLTLDSDPSAPIKSSEAIFNALKKIPDIDLIEYQSLKEINQEQIGRAHV